MLFILDILFIISQFSQFLTQNEPFVKQGFWSAKLAVCIFILELSTYALDELSLALFIIELDFNGSGLLAISKLERTYRFRRPNKDIMLHELLELINCFFVVSFRFTTIKCGIHFPGFSIIFGSVFVDYALGYFYVLLVVFYWFVDFINVLFKVFPQCFIVRFFKFF